jgi:type VI secretion system protein ImpE
MNATELYKAGKIQEAIDAQIQEVKANPADQGKRLFLFELLAFAGDLDRARRQIDAVNYGNMELDAAVLSYRKLLDSEQARRRLFSDGLVPRFFGAQPEHVYWRLEAVNRLRENKPGEAAQCLAKATEACAPVSGELNDKPFTSFRDADDLLGGIVEVMAQGQYYWVPVEQIEAVIAGAPKFPRDLLWFPARLEMEGSAGNVHIPVLYPGSHEHADTQVKLGRMTDWKSTEGGPVLGVGAHVFLVDDDAVGLLEWRQLTVHAGDKSPG